MAYVAFGNGLGFSSAAFTNTHFAGFVAFGCSVFVLFLEIRTEEISAVSGTAKIMPRLEESPVITSRDMKTVENR